MEETSRPQRLRLSVRTRRWFLFVLPEVTRLVSALRKELQVRRVQRNRHQRTESDRERWRREKRRESVLNTESVSMNTESAQEVCQTGFCLEEGFIISFLCEEKFLSDDEGRKEGTVKTDWV